VKAELLMVTGLLTAGYSTVDTQDFKVAIIEYQCGHYRDLESADEGYQFNKPEVYQEIQDTCAKVRKGVLEKPKYSIRDL